jgi:hypothetical protein
VNRAFQYGAIVSSCAWAVAYGIAACGTGDAASPAVSGDRVGAYPYDGAGYDGSEGATDGGIEDSTVSSLPCPGEDAPYPACPSPPPSWSMQVQQIVETYCFPCHNRGGAGLEVVKGGTADLFTTASGLRSAGTTALGDLHDCYMPPEDAAALPPADKEALMEWLVCLGPDN